jgi:hypothetical protein
MLKNLPPPICPKCSEPMRFMLVKTGGRKFRCIDCDVPDLGQRTLMRATTPNIVWFHLSTSPEGGRVMSSDSQLSNPPGWDWPSWMKGSMPNPLDFFAAPRNFVQPILPGWFGSVTNITEQNSSAPDTEREIVAAQLRSSAGPRHGCTCRSHC